MLKIIGGDNPFFSLWIFFLEYVYNETGVVGKFNHFQSFLEYITTITY